MECKSKTNVAILVNSLLSGGAEKQSIYLLNALKKEYPTTFIVFHGSLIDDNIIKLIDGNSFKIICLEGGFLYKLVSLHKVLKSNNINFLFTYLTKPNFLGSIVGNLAGVRSIFGGIRSTKLSLWKMFIEKFTMIFLTSATIYNSFLGEKKLSKGLSKNRSIIIPNCFATIAKPIIRTNKDNITIISVGRFDESKDYRTAILTIAELKKATNNFNYLIIGYGKLEANIRSWIKYYKLEKNIKIIINPFNISELLENADIYLSTSIYEGTSNSIMEAMNASLPIVATNVGDNNRLVNNRESGFLHKVGDYCSISKSLLVLLNDYDLRIRYGIISNQILKENYSFKKFQNSYIQLIKSR